MRNYLNQMRITQDKSSMEVVKVNRESLGIHIFTEYDTKKCKKVVRKG